MSFLGGLAGAAGAFTDVANDRIKLMDAEELKRQSDQVEIAKEQRIREINKQDAAQLIRDKFAFETDPANVEAAAKAKNLEQSILNQQKYDQGDKEAEYQGKIARAKASPESQSIIDKRKAEIEKIRKETGQIGVATPDPLESEKKAKLQADTEKAKKSDNMDRAKLLKSELDTLQENINSGVYDDDNTLRIDKVKEFYDKKALYDSLISGTAPSKSTEDSDPFGILTSDKTKGTPAEKPSKPGIISKQSPVIAGNGSKGEPSPAT